VLAEWFNDDIVDTGRLALFFCFLAFIVTFFTTRIITRLIRAGKGPFHDVESKSGVHVHHAVPGLILLIAGAFMSLSASGTTPWEEVAGVLIGIGTSLVLDEFALIVHLSDVYWSDEGRISIEMVGLATACLGLALVGFSPLSFDGVGHGATALSVALLLSVHVAVIVACVAKGRYATALIGAFVPFLAFAVALRLATPTSLWARRLYGPEKLERSRRRAQRASRRSTRWTDLIGGFVAAPPDHDGEVGSNLAG
jgi:hypothetical protein